MPRKSRSTDFTTQGLVVDVETIVGHFWGEKLHEKINSLDMARVAVCPIPSLNSKLR